MALGDSYATVSDLTTYMGSPANVSSALLTAALSAASRAIEQYTGRQFNKTTSASARVYRPDSPVLTWIDDLHTTTDLVIKTDDGDDGTYETTWSASEYQLDPLNGMVDGESGWPYSVVTAADGRRFPCGHRRPALEVTAQWGWAAVPAPVRQACLIMALEIHKLKDSPFGVAGFEELGTIQIRTAMNPLAATLLAPYRRSRLQVA